FGVACTCGCKDVVGGGGRGGPTDRRAGDVGRIAALVGGTTDEFGALAGQGLRVVGGQPCDEVFTDLAGDEPLSVGVGRGGDNAYQDLAALADVDDLAGPAAPVPVLV